MLQLTWAGVAGLGVTGASTGVASAESTDCAAGPFEGSYDGTTVNVSKLRQKRANHGHREFSTGQPKSNAEMTKMQTAGASGNGGQPPKSEAQQVAIGPQSLSIATEYDGIDAEETRSGVPSDSQIAAGKSKVVHAVNVELAVFNKHSGNEQLRVHLDDLFDPVIPTPEGGFQYGYPNVFDPRARYDRAADRFVVAAVQSVAGIDGSGNYDGKEELEEGEAGEEFGDEEGGSATDGDNADEEFSRPPTGYFLVAVSANSNPNSKWHIYRIAPRDNTGLVDYPQLGLDSEAIYLTQNHFVPTDAGELGFDNVTMAILDKSAMYAGEEAPGYQFTDLDNPAEGMIDFTVQPSLQPFSGGSDGPFYFLNSYPHTTADALTLWELTDPLDDPTLTCDTVEVGPYSYPPTARQKGSNSTIDTIGNRLINVDYNDGSLWTAHTIAYDWNGDGNGVAAIRWYEIDAASHEMIQSGVYGEPDTSYFIPTLRSDGDTTIIAHNVSGPDMYVEMDVAGRTADYTPGELEDSIVVQEGESPYDALDDGEYGPTERWGDYNGVSVDPKTGTFWTVSQYSPDIDIPPEADERDPYHTRIAEVSFE